MIYEKKDEKMIVRMDVDDKGVPNGKLYRFIPLQEGIKSIAVPEGVREICFGAFAVEEEDGEWTYHTPKVERIEIPQSVQWIENGAFAFLTLKEVGIAPGCLAIKREGSALLSGDGKRFLHFIDEDMAVDYTLPEGVEEIGEEAFASWTMDVKLPRSVKRIKAYAFGAFSGKVSVPESVEEIDDHAFERAKRRQVWKTVLLVKRGSYAHKWARKHRIKRKIVK